MMQRDENNWGGEKPSTKDGKGHESQCRSRPIMSSIEGKPISTFTFGFEVSANAVTSITRYQEEQTMVKTLKN